MIALNRRASFRPIGRPHTCSVQFETSFKSHSCFLIHSKGSQRCVTILKMLGNTHVLYQPFLNFQ